jgi:predicted RNA-binding protein
VSKRSSMSKKNNSRIPLGKTRKAKSSVDNQPVLVSAGLYALASKAKNTGLQPNQKSHKAMYVNKNNPNDRAKSQLIPNKLKFLGKFTHHL